MGISQWRSRPWWGRTFSPPPFHPPPRPVSVLTPSPSLPCEGGAEELCCTRYCEWYNGLCIMSCNCLGCGEVIQWHFNRLSAFFDVALVLICRIKTKPVRLDWTEGVCWQWERRCTLPLRTDRDVLISDKPRFPVWRHQSSEKRGWFFNTPKCLRKDRVGFFSARNSQILTFLFHCLCCLLFRHHFLSFV